MTPRVAVAAVVVVLALAASFHFDSDLLSTAKTGLGQVFKVLATLSQISLLCDEPFLVLNGFSETTSLQNRTSCSLVHYCVKKKNSLFWFVFNEEHKYNI